MSEPFQDDVRKWMNTIVLACCGALVGAIWYMLQGQLSGIGVQITDGRSDVRVLQSQNADMRGAVKGLEQRVQDLVDTLNRKK